MDRKLIRKREILKEVYSSSLRITVAVLATIGLLEMFMLVYTLLRPELFGEKIGIYRNFYFSLLTVALLYLGLNLYVNQNMDRRYQLLNVVNPICASFFFLWAIGISYLDMTSTGTVNPTVFMTFSMTVPISFFLFPGLYILICLIADAFLLFLVVNSGGYFGLLINTSIFLIFQLLLGYGFLDLKVRLSERVYDEKEQALIDALTGMGNRRSYMDFLKNSIPLSPDFRYLEVDINGLKEVNDNMGHEKGDAMIIGAAECLEQTFGPYGRVFRIGGDEFVVLMNTSRDRLDGLFSKYESRMKEWSERSGIPLVAAYGCASADELPDTDPRELARIADQRMYDAKAEYYRRVGKERRRS